MSQDPSEVQEVVEISRSLPHRPDEIWRFVGRFCSDWHPAIADCVSESGGWVRIFHDSDGRRYRERLTYYSATDRTFRYEMDEGIADIAAYRGEVHVAAEARGTKVIWRAEITAPPDRAMVVAAGTEAVLTAGLDWLAAHVGTAAPPAPPPQTAMPNSSITRHWVEGVPRLSYLSSDMESDTLVLFLHGIGGAATNWTPQLDTFSGSFAVAAWDMRGYGQSTLPFLPSTIEDYCNDILAIQAAAGAKSLVLVGLSMGSWIATSFAMRHPEKLAGLVLAGGCTGMSEAGAEERARFLKARLDPLVAGQSPADFADDILSIIAGPNATEEVRTALWNSTAAIPTESYSIALRVFCNPLETFKFERFTMPVLLVTGLYDVLAPPDEIRAVSRRIQVAGSSPYVGFEVIPEAGHICNLENPAFFDTYLLDFLNSLNLKTRRPKRTRAEKRAAKHQRILDAARRAFCEHGFDQASMEEIAEIAAVSKPTLYQYFGDKDGLLTAVLEEGLGPQSLPALHHTGTLVDRLWHFSWTFAELILRPEALALARLVIGEAARHPAGATQFHNAGPGRAQATIVSFMSHCHDLDHLSLSDPEMAARDLWALVLAGPRDHYLHHVGATPDRKQLLLNIGHGLRIFLLAYSTSLADDIAELENRISAMKTDLSGTMPE